MIHKRHSVKFNFIMNFMLTASSFIFPLITYPYVIRTILPEGVGRVNFAVSVINYFIMVAMIGIPTYGVRACAQVRDDKEKLSKTVHELIIINLALSAICYVVLGIAICLVDRFNEMYTMLWVSSAGILLNAIGANWLYAAMEEYAYITISSLIFKVLSVLVMVLFVKTPENSVIYAVMILLSSYGSYILNFARLRKHITFKRFEKYEFKPHIRTAFVFFAMAVATTIYTNLDAIMLGFMKSDLEVGIYTTAVKIKQLLVVFVTSLGTVLLPRLTYYIKKGNKKEFSDIISKAMRFVIFISIPLVVFFTLCAEESILLIAGERCEKSVVSMQIIMPTVLFIGITNILGIQIMVPTGREKQVAVSVAIGGAVDLVLNAMLIPKMGAAGAAIGTLVAELAVLLAQCIMLKDEIKSINGVTVWRVVLASAVGGAAVMAVKLSGIDGVLLKLLAEAVLFFGVYLILCVLLREPFIREELKDGLKIIKKKQTE